MNENPTAGPPARVGPPPKHHLALMIWLAVFPTLTVLQLLLRGLLAGAPMVLRTLIMATIAVPIVIYGLMPPLQRLRAYLITRWRRP
jgi:antibiotic biosynthesis monooxygenase (ABM) superfamily enzyme